MKPLYKRIKISMFIVLTVALLLSLASCVSYPTVTQSSKGPWHSSRVSNDGMGPYYCLGKNDTCNNKTYNRYDKYCDSCDPDGDNKEG